MEALGLPNVSAAPFAFPPYSFLATCSYRNRRIAEFLKELDLTEGRGTGIPKLYEILKANGAPPPRFETDEARTYFLAEIRIHPAFTGQVPVEAPEEALLVELSDTERAILELCKKGPKSKREILGGLGYNTMTGNTKQALQRLTDLGLITLTIPAIPNGKLQRRRITDKGLAALRMR